MNVVVPVKIQDQYEAFLSDSRALKLQQQIISSDTGVWSDNDDVQKTIENRLGWIHCLDTMLDQVDDINAFCEQVQESGIQALCVAWHGRLEPCTRSIQ